MSGVFLGFVSKEGFFNLDFQRAFDAYVQRFKGKEVELHVSERKTRRSIRQNAAFWSLIKPWAAEEGHNPDDLKRDLLCVIFGTKEVTSLVTGEVTLVPQQQHTSKLSMADFCTLIERTMEIAAGCGYVMQSPEEYRLIKEQERKTAARKGRAA